MTKLTPEQVAEIAARDAQSITWYGNFSEVANEAQADRRALLAHVEALEADLAACRLDAERYRALLSEARRSHCHCEDPWYSCPKDEEGCANEFAGTDCNCGADKWNARIDATLSAQAGKQAGYMGNINGPGCDPDVP